MATFPSIAPGLNTALQGGESLRQGIQGLGNVATGIQARQDLRALNAQKVQADQAKLQQDRANARIGQMIDIFKAKQTIDPEDALDFYSRNIAPELGDQFGARSFVGQEPKVAKQMAKAMDLLNKTGRGNVRAKKTFAIQMATILKPLIKTDRELVRQASIGKLTEQFGTVRETPEVQSQLAPGGLREPGTAPIPQQRQITAISPSKEEISGQIISLGGALPKDTSLERIEEEAAARTRGSIKQTTTFQAALLDPNITPERRRELLDLNAAFKGKGITGRITLADGTIIELSESGGLTTGAKTSIQKDVAELNTVLAEMKVLQKQAAITADDVLGIKGRVSNFLANVINSVDPTQEFGIIKKTGELKAISNTMFALFIKSMSGKQVSDKEREFLEAGFPNVGDKSPQDFKVKLDAVTLLTQRRRDGLIKEMNQSTYTQALLDTAVRKPSSTQTLSPEDIAADAAMGF